MSKTFRITRRRIALLLIVGSVMSGMMMQSAEAQGPSLRFGNRVPTEVRVMYERGLQYLAKTQTESGTWSSSGIGHGGAGESGITGLCLMVFLASGEDPNFGRYSSNVRRATRAIIMGQDSRTGFLPGSMYHHGFATLGLSEAYGTVDDSLLWSGAESAPNKRSIGQALELAVRCALTSQKNNQWGAWRYSPQSTDADTSVAGAVLVGLLAARNAGIEIPDENLEKALKYFRTSTSKTGMVAYSGGVGGHGESMNRSSIATLVFAVGKKKDWDQYRAALGHIVKRLEHPGSGYTHYFRYYMAQALFQGDFDSWQKWNREIIRKLKNEQAEDGSFNSRHGQAYGTAMSLLVLALNYRFLPIYER